MINFKEYIQIKNGIDNLNRIDENGIINVKNIFPVDVSKFKNIILSKDTPPYNLYRKEYDVANIIINKLVSTQSTVYTYKIKNLINSIDKWFYKAFIVISKDELSDRYYIQDGHHRAVASALTYGKNIPIKAYIIP